MGRIERVNQQIKEEISNIILKDLSDPRLEFVSITEVDVSPDLKNARVSFSFLGDSSRKQSVEQAFKSAKGLIRRLVAQRIQIRYIPDLSFHYDDSLEKSAKIEKTLQEIKDELGNSNKNI